MALQRNKQKYCELTRNISKAISPIEQALDYKLTRDIILLTHHLQDGDHVWNTLQQQQNFGTNPFSAWKICCLLHRLLRDGHCEIMRMGQHKRAELENLRDYWTRESVFVQYVGVPVWKYFHLLLIKLDFHKMYTFFNGDLHMNRPEEWDLNVCFQLASDVLDYLEAILDLLAEIFYDIEVQNLPMTSSQSQCRLTNVLTLITECDMLQMNFITIQEVLIRMLPAIDVVGINNRFYEIFERLTKWFAYFHTLHGALQMELVPSSLNTIATAPAICDAEIRRSDLPIPSAPMENEFF